MTAMITDARDGFCEYETFGSRPRLLLGVVL